VGPTYVRKFWPCTGTCRRPHALRGFGCRTEWPRFQPQFDVAHPTLNANFQPGLPNGTGKFFRTISGRPIARLATRGLGIRPRYKLRPRAGLHKCRQEICRPHVPTCNETRKEAESGRSRAKKLIRFSRCPAAFARKTWRYGLTEDNAKGKA